jgi:hypothetical protein
MANIKSFPNNQDVYIGAEDVMKWLHGRTSGVFAAEGNAAVSALVDSTMAVTVSDGLGWMANAGKDGVVWWIDNEATSGAKLQLSIDPADGVLNRIDRIIVEWRTTNYVDYPEVKVLKGKTSSRATAPALTNNSIIRQISLARINIAAGTTAITASMVTDERLDPSVCGLVTESISIDTSTMNKQFNELLSLIETNLRQITNDQILDKSVTVPKLAKDTLNYINAKNLLVNSNFTNPVNRSGKTSYSGTGYGLDRWESTNSRMTVTVKDDCVNIAASDVGAAYLRQMVMEPLNGIYTLVLCARGTGTCAMYFSNSGSSIGLTQEFPLNEEWNVFFYTVNTEDGAATPNQFSLTVQTGENYDIKYVAVYEGEYAGESLPSYVPNGYSAELAAISALDGYPQLQEQINSAQTQINSVQEQMGNKSNTLYVGTVTKDNISFSADEDKSITFDASKSGYTPIGIVGWRVQNASSGGQNSSLLNVYRVTLSGTEGVVNARNTGSSSAKVRIIIYPLFVKS